MGYQSKFWQNSEEDWPGGAFESLGTWNPIQKEEKNVRLESELDVCPIFVTRFMKWYVERACRPAYNFGYSYVQYWTTNHLKCCNQI